MDEMGDLQGGDLIKDESSERISNVEIANNLSPDEVSLFEQDQDLTIDRREDVKSLLNFMNLASDNIKASLDRSISCKRTVDHKKYLQKQLQHFTNSSHPLSSFGGPTYPPPGTASVKQQSCFKNKPDQYQYISTKATHAVNKGTSPSEESLHQNKDSDNSNSLKEEYKNITQINDIGDTARLSSDIYSLPSGTITLSMATVSDSQVPEPKTSADNEEDTDSDQPEKTVKVTADLVLMDSLFKQSEPGEKIVDTKAGDKKSVPLRQRSLPASFWKEPNNVPIPGDKRYANGYSLMQYHPQLPAHMLEYNSNTLENLYRLPHNSPYHAASVGHPAIPEVSFTSTLTNLEFRKISLPPPYDENIAAHLGLCNDISSRNYPYMMAGSSRILSARDYTNGPVHLSHLNMHCVAVPSGLENGLHAGRVHGQSCLDCCLPRHQPFSLTSGVVQPPVCCRIPPINSVLSQRPSLWKPIPTKSISSFPSRYHPFAGVQ